MCSPFESLRLLGIFVLVEILVVTIVLFIWPSVRPLLIIDEEYDSTREQVTDEIGRVHELEAEITQLSKENQTLREKQQKQESRLQKKKEKLERQNAEKDEKITELESRVASLNSSLEETTKALSREKEAAMKQEQRIRDLSATNQQMKAVRLPSRTTVNKADRISVVEVADLVRILNAQIEQLSSLLTDSFHAREPSIAGKTLEVMLDELNDYIGPWLCNYLKRRSQETIKERDPLIVQVTLQTGLVSACSRIINDWNPPFWIDSLIFARTYKNIEKTDGQAAADAWRTLSETHMTVSKSEREEANKMYITQLFLKLMTAVGGSLESGGIFLSQHKEKVDDIVQRATGLHKTVSEDVSSVELIAYTSPSHTSFDSSQMEDTERNASESRSGSVACTVGMGLLCRKRNESAKKSKSREELGVAVKAKVVLAATLELEG